MFSYTYQGEALICLRRHVSTVWGCDTEYFQEDIIRGRIKNLLPVTYAVLVVILC